MPKFKNISPQGDLDFPLLGRVIAAGEVFDASDAQSIQLSAQPDLWQPIKKETGK